MITNWIMIIYLSASVAEGTGYPPPVVVPFENAPACQRALEDFNATQKRYQAKGCYHVR